MVEDFVCAGLEQLRCSTTLDVENEPNVEAWLTRLYHHVEKHVPIATPLMNQSCLQLLTEITVTFEDSQSFGRLTDIKLVTLEQIAFTSCNVTMHGTICPMKNHKSQASEAVDCSYEKLIPQLVVLVGRLTCQPRNYKPTEEVGAVYFEDGTATVVCEVSSSSSLLWLDTPVVLSSWIYVPKHDFMVTLLKAPSDVPSLPPFGYLEIMGCVPFTCHLGSVDQIMPSLTPEPVECLVSKSSLSGERVIKRSVYGVVKTISPVNRNGTKSPYFLIELTDLNHAVCVPLIVQEPELLHLQQLLKLDHVYVISDLIYVTVKHQSEKTLWAATKDSVFSESQTTLTATELTYSSNHSLNSYSDSLDAKRGVKRPSSNDQTYSRAKRFVTDEGNTETGQEERIPKRQSDCRYPLVSYVGEITKCVNAAACIYELDSKMLLYIGHQPSTRYGRGLRVGAKVRLTNAHLVREKGLTGFFCCSASKVDILKFSLYNSPYCPVIDSMSVYYKHLPCMAPSDFDWYVDSAEWLARNFRGILSEKEILGGFQLKLGVQKWYKGLIDKLYLAMRTSSTSCSITTCDEVFSTPHSCKLTALKPHKFPPLRKIDDIKADCIQLTKRNNCVQDSWSGFTDSNSEVVIGFLRGCPESGRLQLTDSSGSINIVTVALDSGHESMNCPFAQPSHLEGLWFIRDFKMACETFDINAGSNRKSTLPYLLVDMRHCVQLKVKHKKAPSCKVCLDKFGQSSELYQNSKSLKLMAKDPLSYGLFYSQFSGEESQTVLLEFQKSEVKLYDFLRVGMRYHLQGVCAECLNKQMGAAVLHPILFDSSLMKMSEEEPRSELKMSNVWEILVVDKERNSLASFVGVIISRQLELSNKPQHPDSQPHPSLHLFPTGTQHNIILKIRDLTRPDVITLYIEPGKWIYSLGLLCGSQIAVYRAIKRMSQSSNVYCVFAASTCIEVLSYQPQLLSITNPNAELCVGDLLLLDLCRTFLCDFAYDSVGNPIVQYLCRVQVRISYCQRVMLKWECRRCRQTVKGKSCSKCLSDVQTFKAEAKFIIDDSSGEAVLFADDSLVCDILHLTSKQWGQLQQATQPSGTLLYVRNWHGGDNHWKVTVDKSSLLLAECCNLSTSGRTVNVFCRQVPTKRDEYSRRTITVRGTEQSTLVRPRLLLRCVKICELYHHAEAMTLLAALTNE